MARKNQTLELKDIEPVDAPLSGEPADGVAPDAPPSGEPADGAARVAYERVRTAATGDAIYAPWGDLAGDTQSNLIASVIYLREGNEPRTAYERVVKEVLNG